jgi:hypothetical protein
MTIDERTAAIVSEVMASEGLGAVIDALRVGDAPEARRHCRTLAPSDIDQR